MTDRAVLTLCATCGPDAAALRAALQDLPVEVRQQDCLNLCAEPQALALQGEGRATYLFAGLDLPADAGDVMATVQAYLDAPEGWIEDARPCGRLRDGLKARVRAL